MAVGHTRHATRPRPIAFRFASPLSPRGRSRYGDFMPILEKGARFLPLVYSTITSTFVPHWPPDGPLDTKKSPYQKVGASLNREASRLGDVGATRGGVGGPGPGSEPGLLRNIVRKTR